MERKIIRPITDVEEKKKNFLSNEWLVTNGLGGYASGTLVGVTTRKYHGLLIAALPPPHGRYIMLNELREEVLFQQTSYCLNCEEKIDGSLNLDALNYLKKFFLEEGLPVWHYQLGEVLIEKRIFMSYRQNTVYISYELLEGPEEVTMRLFPGLNFRAHEDPVDSPLETEYVVTAIGNKYEIGKKEFLPVRIFSFGDETSGFTMQPAILSHVFFSRERQRGYAYSGDVWNPGFFHLKLHKNARIGLVASTESWGYLQALSPAEAHRAEIVRRQLILHHSGIQEDRIKELALAADQFIIVPEYRRKDTVRAHAFGEELRTIIAGYHWFTDWGRDTMISLEGLTLCTKRYREARWILKTFAYYVREGLLPNMFPEGEQTGLYHTADATLWFFHAVDRYYTVTHDTLLLDEILPILEEILHFHIKGTLFGIGMDPHDKLLRQGAPEYQLTWMDAKVEDWVVTPRRGKAVEINALWYNALKIMEQWVGEQKKALFCALAEEIKSSFNRRFWIPKEEYLFDVVDGENGDDPSFRPNQIFSFSLKYPVLNAEHWEKVLRKVHDKLLTPYGLRTLEVTHPDFKANYEGDLRSRDAAYHQGTVWPWLIGPFIDGWLKVYPTKGKEAAHFLEALFDHLGDEGIGTMSEIFDATPPYKARGCIAQAWSVAETLRAWMLASHL